MLKKFNLSSVLWDYTIISFGTLLYCLAWTMFMIPNEIASGGLTGACAILEYASGIPLKYSYIVANVCLLAAGTAILGKGFGFRTIWAIMFASLMFWILPKIQSLPSLEWMTSKPGSILEVKEKILIPIIGGLMEGLGIYFIFRKGGSTGGTDVLALVMNKFWPISPGKVYLYSDLVIISTVLLLPGKGLQDMLYGYICMITFSLSVDALLMGEKSSVQVLIFSEKNHQIADYILNQMNRGVTALKSVGWYTKAEKNVLLIIIRKTQLVELTKNIKEIDKNAFVSISTATSVYGEGFEQIKTGMERKKKDAAIKVAKEQINTIECSISKNTK